MQSPNGEYLTNEQAWELLGISRTTFYRKYYTELVDDPSTRMVGDSPRYRRDVIEALFRRPSPLRTFERRAQMRQVRYGMRPGEEPPPEDLLQDIAPESPSVNPNQPMLPGMGLDG